MNIIALLNEKGGVGKTSLATHLAAGLAIRGERVMLVDSDPQGHATIAFGFAKEPGIHQLLTKQATFQDVMKVVPINRYAPEGATITGTLYLIPSNIDTRLIPGSIEDGLIVRRRFSELRNAIDTVIFDTSPTPSILHGSILMAVSGIIYPTKLEVWSFDGLRESMGHKKQFDTIRKSRSIPEIETLGIVPTMKRSKTVEHEANEELLRKSFGAQVWETVPERTIWAEVASAKKMVYALAPRSKAAGDAWKLVDKLQERVDAR